MKISKEFLKIGHKYWIRSWNSRKKPKTQGKNSTFGEQFLRLWHQVVLQKKPELDIISLHFIFRHTTIWRESIGRPCLSVLPSMDAMFRTASLTPTKSRGTFETLEQSSTWSMKITTKLFKASTRLTYTLECGKQPSGKKIIWI